ncbi:MAG: V-type ATP synthase subunit D [Spirochaetota bacterium]
MAKFKLTKNELKKQKDALKRFQRYLPTLLLKKQQLQIVIRQVEAKERETLRAKNEVENRIINWVEVFGEDAALETLLLVKAVYTDTGNIAGVDIPVYKSIDFDVVSYNLFAAPLWIDRAIEELKLLLALDSEIKILKRQIELLGNELRITTQRVNLFEKVKIPEAKESIRKIRIYLGDQQTAAVVRGKMAKDKVVKAS